MSERGPGHYDVPQRVGDAVREHGLWAAGQRVAVSVSGGLDSVVLLHSLVQTAAWHQGRLSVVTIDHGTRDDSAADAAFVAQQSRELGLACTVERANLGPGASEAAAREARRRVWDALDVDVVAIAHHANDQAETLLLQLLRGAGTRGLASMRPRRGRLVRPMLDLDRATIADWAVREGLTWREDPSNRDARFLRNRVRHEVLPLLTAIRPGAVRALARSARVTALDDALLDERVPDMPSAEVPVPLQLLAALPDALLRRALLNWLPGLSASHVDAAVAVIRAGRGRTQLPGGRWLRIETSTEGDIVRMVRIPG